MLASVWNDPEDALIYECALSLKADAIISRNAADFQKGVIPIMTCQEFFEYMYKEHGFHYVYSKALDEWLERREEG